MEHLIAEFKLTSSVIKKINKDLLKIFYENYILHKTDFAFTIDYDWFRIYNNDIMTTLENPDNVLRLYLIPKYSKLLEIISFLLECFFSKRFGISTIKFWNMVYDETLGPVDIESDENSPAIVIYFTHDIPSFEYFRDLLIEKYKDVESYIPSKIPNIGTKRTKINDLIYWSNYTTTRQKYLKYKNKYIMLKNKLNKN
jgi:hypothetical protein